MQGLTSRRTSEARGPETLEPENQSLAGRLSVCGVFAQPRAQLEHYTTTAGGRAGLRAVGGGESWVMGGAPFCRAAPP